MRRLLDENPLTGEQTVFEYDKARDRMVITHEQDVTPILDANKRMAANMDLTKKGIKNDMWHYATIPNIVAVKWKQEHGVDIWNREHRKKMFALLNSPDYAYLKTTTYKHGG